MLFIPFIIAVVGAYLGFVYASFSGGIAGFIVFGLLAQWVRGIATNNEYQDLPDVSLSPRPQPTENANFRSETDDAITVGKSPTSDEEYYKAALDEYHENEKVPETWAKALTLCEGNQEKAKWKYVELRVEWLNAQDVRTQKKTLADDIVVSKVTIHQDLDLATVEQAKSIPLFNRLINTLMRLAIFITTRLLLAFVLTVIFGFMLAFIITATGMNNLAPYIPIFSLALSILAIKMFWRGSNTTPSD